MNASCSLEPIVCEQSDNFLLSTQLVKSEGKNSSKQNSELKAIKAIEFIKFLPPYKSFAQKLVQLLKQRKKENNVQSNLKDRNVHNFQNDNILSQPGESKSINICHNSTEIISKLECEKNNDQSMHVHGAQDVSLSRELKKSKKDELMHEPKTQSAEKDSFEDNSKVFHNLSKEAYINSSSQCEKKVNKDLVFAPQQSLSAFKCVDESCDLSTLSKKQANNAETGSLLFVPQEFKVAVCHDDSCHTVNKTNLLNDDNVVENLNNSCDSMHTEENHLSRVSDSSDQIFYSAENLQPELSRTAVNCFDTRDVESNASENLFALNLTRTGFAITPPIGAPYVHGSLTIKGTKLSGFAPMILDTGCERSLIDKSVALALFGKSYKAHLCKANKPVKMLSATNHKMPHQGFLHLEIKLGTFHVDHYVAVNEFSKGVTLLGNDVILDHINIDHGRSISFTDKKHSSIPIVYHLPVHSGHLTRNLVVAPHTNVTASVKLHASDRVKGREVFVTSPCSRDSMHKIKIEDTLGIVKEDGTLPVLFINSTDEQYTVDKNSNIAEIHFLAPCNNEDSGLYCKETDHAVLGQVFKTTLEERKNFMDGTADAMPDPDGFTKLDPVNPDDWFEQIPHDHLNTSQWEKLKSLVIEMGDAFVRNTNEMGLCKYFEAELPVKEGTPYLYSPPRPIPHQYRDEVDKIMQDYLNLGIIRKSTSPFATNVVCVKRKAVNGVVKLRCATDLRKLNSASVPCRFPNTGLDDALAKIGNARYRSSLDFRNAFFQISIVEEHRKYTSFFCNGIQYEYTRLPMGHISAMGIFCIMMELLCENFPNGIFFADDVMCITIDKISNDEAVYDKHLEHLREMFRRIIHAGLKLNPAKCNFANHSSQPMDWLGFTIEQCLLLPQKSKVDKVLNFPVPTTGKQALSFVSLASFYRRFIKSFAKIAKPIHEAIHKEPFEWTNEADTAMDDLKQKLTKYPLLRIPQLDQPFQIYTDASASAIGAVLTQIDPTDGKKHPCAYASRKFSETEMSLSIPCKELLAIIYALHMWSIYILGNRCEVFSDCKAWSFLKLAAAKSGKISRLALVVQEYDIDVSYVPAQRNLAADGLSRQYDTGETKYDDITGIRDPKLEALGAPKLKLGETVPLDEYLARCEKYLQTNEWSQKVSKAPQQAQYVDNLIQASNLVHCDVSYTRRITQSLRTADINEGENSITPSSDSFPLRIALVALKDSCFSREGFAAMQRNDAFLRKIRRAISNPETNQIPASVRSFFTDKDILFRKVKDVHGQERNVLCIPDDLVDYLLNYYHSSLLSGHLGPSRLFAHLKQIYYWRNMEQSVKHFYDNCLNCQYNAKYPVKVALGTALVPQYPNHIVHIDILSGMPRARNGASVLLLMYDGFSKFCYSLPLRDANADRIVADFMQYYVPILGAPFCLHSDRAQNLDGLLMHRIARMIGMRKARTPNYNPQSNPCEVLCGIVGDLMRKWVSLDDQKQWPHFLAYILYALNFTTNTATGFTPASLMLGRINPQPLIPLIPVNDEVATHSEFLESIRRFQEYAFQLTRARHTKLRDKRKETKNVNAFVHNYQPGDFVMVRDLQPGAKGDRKLRPRYRGPYRVVRAFESSLQVIPWDESQRLDEIEQAPQFVQRLNAVKPFLTDTVPVRLCKPCKFSPTLPPRFDNNLMDKLIELLGDYECPDFESVYDDDPDRMAELLSEDQSVTADDRRPPSSLTSTVDSRRHRPRHDQGTDDDDDDSDGGDLGARRPRQGPHLRPRTPPTPPDEDQDDAQTPPRFNPQIPGDRRDQVPLLPPQVPVPATRQTPASPHRVESRTATPGAASAMATPTDQLSFEVPTPSQVPGRRPSPPQPANTPLHDYNLRDRTPKTKTPTHGYNLRTTPRTTTPQPDRHRKLPDCSSPPIRPAKFDLDALIEQDLLLHPPPRTPPPSTTTQPDERPTPPSPPPNRTNRPPSTITTTDIVNSKDSNHSLDTATPTDPIEEDLLPLPIEPDPADMPRQFHDALNAEIEALDDYLALAEDEIPDFNPDPFQSPPPPTDEHKLATPDQLATRLHDQLNRPIRPLVNPSLVRSFTPVTPDLDWDNFDPIDVLDQAANSPQLAQAQTHTQATPSDEFGLLPPTHTFDSPTPVDYEMTRRFLRPRDDHRTPLRSSAGRKGGDAHFSPQGAGVPSSENFQNSSPLDRTYDIMQPNQETPRTDDSSVGIDECITTQQSTPAHGAIPKKRVSHRIAPVEQHHTRAQDAVMGQPPSVREQIQLQEEKRREKAQQRREQREARIERLSRPKASRQGSPKPTTSKKSTKSNKSKHSKKH